MLCILARIGSPAVVGQYALGIAVSMPVVMLLPSGRRTVNASGMRILLLVFALLGIAAIGFLDRNSQDLITIGLAAAAQMVEWIADRYAGLRQPKSTCLHAAVSLIALAAAGAATRQAGAGLLAMVIARLLVLFLHDFRMPVWPLPHDGREKMLVSFAGCVPCYFIAHMLGLHELGVFSAVAGFTSLVLVLARSAAGFKTMLLWMVLATSVGPPILGLLFGPEYARPVLLAALMGVGSIALLLDRVRPRVLLNIAGI